ncbi:rhodanese-like domain-containing protein [Candidatus Thioglobus sp.]|jgi:rhodanese-related sulfurtransferase|nr:rhodanese-like domain-containing protein [Candidatus Thioglobus sp.]MDC0390461.1 rhodanese-like domain-containing protein [Candidatus Thioglobus sp.]MDC0407047.1 rhodanese-like domain-containing protein [Candidatus Thioglobus sp.]
MIKNYLPKKAVKLILEGAILIDVRCEAENKFVGRVPNSILIPWLDEPEWEVDEEKFIKTFSRFDIDKDTEIILICRSGYRSNDAGKCLVKNGFTNIAHVVSGFEGDLDEENQRGNVNGWRHEGMPWIQC